MVEFDDQLYLFATDNSGNNQGLWSIDGTTGDTCLITTDVIGVNGNFIEFDGKLYFNGYDESYNSNAALWSTDGTSEGTSLVANGYSSGELTEFNGRLYFSATDEIHGTELWSTDGTSEGTSLFTDIIPGVENSSPEELVVLVRTFLWHNQVKLRILLPILIWKLIN